MKKTIKIILIIGIIFIGLIVAFYISKKTNKPCIHVEPDCEKFCKTINDTYQCAICQPYTYCGPEALLDKIQHFKIFGKRK